ncbi:MAG: hypothetical protein JST40_00110 [Armatimonadetes bacterium]|nr:hypothetical protein [Armatimonadota bacterium]
MSKSPKFRWANAWSALTVAFVASSARATVIPVEVASTRSLDQIDAQVDAAVRVFGRNMAELTRRERQAKRDTSILSMPVTVVLKRSGREVPPPTSRGRDTSISLSWGTGIRAFPTDYQAFLQSIYSTVKPRLDAVFGQPALGGNVLVSNFDADIGERDAVAGGAYVADWANNVQEIRFPIYADIAGYKLESAAVNFVHCLLLAYIGPKNLPNDGWQEGLVRSAVMQVSRTPGALPAGLDQDVIEQQLESTYDIGPTYEWQNQSALAGPAFIAPNLRDLPLPIGGSTGGLYLLRYQMAGSAMQKVLVEYPGFAAEFLSRWYANPIPSQIASLAQASLDTLGGSGSTVEGLTFGRWMNRQRILDGTLIPGEKLQVQPFPITSNLGGTDFGVFGIQVHYFRTDASGNETLLTGTSYPVFWSPSYTRFFTAGQDDKVSIGAGYGAVAPNFPATSFGGEAYRVAVDVPVNDRVSRSYLPAGAIATATNPNPNDVYGVITGNSPSDTAAYQVALTWASGLVTQTLPVTHSAFGATITDENFRRSQRRIKVMVLRNGDVIATRWVNKGPGSLALNLHIEGEGDIVWPGGLQGGVDLRGFVGEPYSSDVRQVVQSNVLAARWNHAAGRYQFYPSFGNAGLGQGFFIRSNANQAVTYDGLLPGKTPLPAACNQGWNLVVNPLNEAVDVTQLVVVRATDFARSYQDAAAAGLIAPDMFTFLKGSSDPATGFAETGSLVGNSVIEPGQGVFVKVLVPEGVLILFPTREYQSSGRSTGPGVRYELRARLYGPNGMAQAMMVGRLDGNSKIQPGIDSELPPSMGGLELSLGGNSRLYRDVRSGLAPETFLIQMANAVPGAKYRLEIQVTQGSLMGYSVRLPNGIKVAKTRSANFEFIARQSSGQIRVTAARSSR